MKSIKSLYRILLETLDYNTVKPRNLLILGPSKTQQISKSADYRLQQGWTCCSVLHCQNRGLGAVGWRANGKNFNANV